MSPGTLLLDSKYVENLKNNHKISNSAFNPRIRIRRADDTQNSEESDDSSQIDVFGDNPNWDPGWVKAYRINVTGQVSLYRIVLKHCALGLQF